MHLSRFRFGLVALASVLASSNANAWDKPGHAVTASIAYDELEANNPAVLAKAVTILKASDDYTKKLKWKSTVDKSTLPEALLLLQLAARWPDDIKTDGSHRDTVPVNTHSWHYINLPAGPGADGHPAATPNLFTAFAEKQTEWQQAQTDKQRAVLLCWFIHLIGDSHQPLHTAEFFDPTHFPHGDAGGVTWAIAVTPATPAGQLHSFWDEVVITGDNPAKYANQISQLADTLRRNYPRSQFQSQLAAHATLPDWAKNETYALAISAAYHDGANWLPFPTPTQPTTLTAPYMTNAHSVAEAQLALAGYRIADFLTQLLK